MPLRMISYQNRIWDRFVEEHPGAPLAPVIAVLVSHVPGGWTAARAFKELFDPAVMALSGLIALVPRFSMIVDDLAQLSNDDLATRPLPAFPKLALWLLRDARDSAPSSPASMRGSRRCSNSTEPARAGTALPC